MNYEFNRRVNRENCGNIKRMLFTPDSVYESGVVSYAGAEFEFPTAPSVIDAVKRAADNGLFGFTVADGNYLDHVVWWVKNVRGTDILPEWIVPVQGTIFSVATAIRLFTEPGEAIIIVAPGYNRYRQAAERLGRRTLVTEMVYPTQAPYGRGGGESAGDPDGTAVTGSLSDCPDVFLPAPEINFADLEAKLALPECRLLVFSNPNNPTGKILKEDELRRILELAAKHHVAVLQDEIFADVVLEKEPDGEKTNRPRAGDVEAGNTLGEPAVPMLSVLSLDVPGSQAVSVISLGKTFSFTGVNSAIAIIPDGELRECFMRQRDADHFGSIDPMAYAALCGGFTPEGKEWLQELVRVIRGNNQKFIDFFAEYLPGVKVVKPQATYLLWADFTSFGMNCQELRRFLIEEAKFCCDMGDEYYGADTWVRICTAVPPQEIDRSLGIFKEALKKHGIGNC